MEIKGKSEKDKRKKRRLKRKIKELRYG